MKGEKLEEGDVELWLTHHAPEDIPVCLDKSLKDLQLDYLDLYLVHFPVGLKKMGDELFPKKDGKMLTSDIDYVDVWRGMEALQASGKVRSIGVSNFSILQLQRLLALCRAPPAVNQVIIIIMGLIYTSTVCGALMCSGRAFHSLGATEQKAQSPIVRSLFLGGLRRLAFLEREVRKEDPSSAVLNVLELLDAFVRDPDEECIAVVQPGGDKGVD
ncbi:aldose reductase-like [Notothenia coriiceps]|uniref:Aldose reductase-like n=1 Tax=Notothenia coriiceps TaxID=8208 RepID=A0A6I9P7F7_9TELE|nr:PREDICTED: aldose reductase-like [Notothenia coriiceps]